MSKQLLKRHFTLKNIFILLYVCIGIVILYIPFQDVYLHPGKNSKELLSLFAPFGLVLGCIGLFVYAINKRL